MARKVEVGWDHEGEDYRVRCRVTAGTRATRMDPGDPPEVEVLSVFEDRAGGAERPELVDVAQADLKRIEELAVEAAVDEDDARADDERDRDRDARLENARWGEA